VDTAAAIAAGESMAGVASACTQPVRKGAISRIR
jgi:hypothetical protein